MYKILEKKIDNCTQKNTYVFHQQCGVQNITKENKVICSHVFHQQCSVVHDYVYKISPRKIQLFVYKKTFTIVTINVVLRQYLTCAFVISVNVLRLTIYYCGNMDLGCMACISNFDFFFKCFLFKINGGFVRIYKRYIKIFLFFFIHSI